MNQAAYASLVNRLSTVQSLYPLVKENETIQAKKPFSRATLIRSRPRQATAGITGKNLHTGLLQIDLLVPLNTGSAQANALADEIIAAFPRGLELPSDPAPLHIVTAYRETPGRFNDQFHQVSVVVEVKSIY